MPNVRKQPRRSVVIPDELWDKAKARAESRGETVSAAIRKFLERYTR